MGDITHESGVKLHITCAQWIACGGGILGRDLATRRLDHLHLWPRLPSRWPIRTRPAGSSKSGRVGDGALLAFSCRY